MSKQIQVSQLLATPDLTYVNGEVSGLLTNIRPPNGRGPSKAKLQDSTGTIEVSLWGAGVSHWEGKNVLFSGKGMQIKEFRGTKQLSVGDKVVMASAPEEDAIPGDPPDPHSYRVPPRQAPRNAPSEHLPVNLPHGATVGGAIARAVDIWLATQASAGAAWDAKALDWVESVARELVGASQRMERGEEMPPF